MYKSHRSAADIPVDGFDSDGHVDLVVETSWMQILHCAIPHHEIDPVGGPQATLFDSERAQPVGARTLEEAEIVGVVDDPAGVRVLVVHATRDRDVQR